MSGEWFQIESGEHEGRWHLQGWQKTAIKVLDGGDEYGWLGLYICPRCSAIVFADGPNAFLSNQWTHEQWHARTDYPIPAESVAGGSNP